MFTSMLFFCVCVFLNNNFYDRAMSSPEKLHWKITIIIIIIINWKHWLIITDKFNPLTGLSQDNISNG